MPASRQAPRPSAFRGLLPNVLLSVAALIVAIVAAEIACRVVSIGPEYWSPRRDVAEPRGSFERVPFGFVPHAVIRSVYPSNPRGYFDAGNSIDHEFNSVGWRDMEHALEKPANTYRVLGLGDSYLYGQGVRYSDICLTRLQQLLQATSPPGITVETINTGISGFNTENERDSLAARGLQYEPDLVIVHFVLNDIEPEGFKPGPKVDFFTEYTDTYMVPDWLSAYSKLWGLLRQTYLRRVTGARYIRQSLRSYRHDPAKFETMWAALKDIQDLRRRHHIELVVAIFPFFYNLDGDYPFRPIHERLTRRGEQAGIRVLDLYPAFKTYRGPSFGFTRWTSIRTRRPTPSWPMHCSDT